MYARAPWAIAVLGCIVCSVGVVACGSAQRFPSRALPLPEQRAPRDELFDQLGRRAFAMLVSRETAGLLLDDDALRAILQPQAAGEAAALRVSAALLMQATPDASAVLASARYAGVCLQRARVEPAGPPLGLREPGFAIDRLLVVGVEPGGGKIAAWVEGSFVLTDQGFFALQLQRLETPRRDHADLDLAPCDFEIGVRSPRQVVVSTPDSH